MNILWKKDLESLQNQIPSLPWYVEKFIDHKLVDLAPSSLLLYARDYQEFLTWMIAEGLSASPAPKDVTLSDLEQLYVENIDSYQAFLRTFKANSSATRERKMAALKSLFHYLSQIAEDEDHYPLLKRNVMAKIRMKKRSKDEIILSKLEGKILESDKEIYAFLDFIRNKYITVVADNKQALYYYKINQIRDISIISLILFSGLRVAEVTNLDVKDIDLAKKIAYVYRKGYGSDNSKQAVYFAEEAKVELEKYLEIRESIYTPDRAEGSLFLATARGQKQGKRMSKRAVQQLVIKYAQAFGKPQLTVHKLRHSFATSYYLHNDIYKTSRQLGHKSTDSTQIYAMLSDKTMAKAIDFKKVNRE
ncbi:tyrosine recombinase XerS [Bacillus horti]|uniref:Integrase n=1 Tax=Caldalkalibacillus horti TaxID=77523 RepID=A0ABT9VYD2_9BACI|nr:tyrosine recombinase XerS [Bacillus horti]MDQ0166000.1 integrase [Bacillus horti]